MATLSLLDVEVPVDGYKLPLNEAVDLDGYREFAPYFNVQRLTVNPPTTKATVKLWHAARNRVADYVEVSGQSHDFTGDDNSISYVSEFSRFIIATVEWDDAAGGTCDVEILLVPKR